MLAPDDAEVEAYLETALNAPAPDRTPDGDIPPTEALEPDRVVVLDFGSQFAQLIARRVRELNVYSELLPHDTPWAEIERRRPKAIILSGVAELRLRRRRPEARLGHLDGRIPVLGICYGAQLMAHELGGDVAPTGRREYGPATVHDHRRRRPVRGPRPRPAGLDEPRRLDHPAAGGLPDDRPDRLDPSPARGPARGLYGIQFHPEVVHTPHGRDVLRNFVHRHRRREAHLDAGELRGGDRRRASGPASTPTPPRRARTAG